nr:hypothetical protein [Stackebrandtia endophytica]
MAVAEQRLQQLDLGVRGVLVLVQQHDGVAFALDLGDLNDPAGQVGGLPQLVGEVLCRNRLLPVLVLVNQRQQLQAGPQPGHQFLDRFRRT